jgi:hypothetical protein
MPALASIPRVSRNVRVVPVNNAVINLSAVGEVPRIRLQREGHWLVPTVQCTRYPHSTLKQIRSHAHEVARIAKRFLANGVHFVLPGDRMPPHRALTTSNRDLSTPLNNTVRT